jgi:hypothetical protein
MLLKILKKYIDMVKRVDPREDDEVIVQRFDRFNDILHANEQILWQGSPSIRHAWGDHDQMEPAGSAGDRPASLLGRKVEMILALVFIFFMFLFGAGSFYVGIGELLQKQDFVLGIFLALVGLTFMSGLPFLLRPLSNCLRTKQLTYLLTTSRTMIVRRGHAWAEVWVRSPVILSVSLLFIYSVIMFSGLYIEGLYLGYVNDAGWNSWLARGFALIFFVPIGGIFATIGYIGFRFQFAIITDAIKGRHDIFVRSFNFSEIRRHDFPVVSRLRKGGLGDVILGQDGHWGYNVDFQNAPWFKTNAVGFLSVPDAKQVMEKIERMVTDEEAV